MRWSTMKTRILFVAPFANLAILAEEVVAERFAASAHLIKVVKGDENALRLLNKPLRMELKLLLVMVVRLN